MIRLLVTFFGLILCSAASATPISVNLSDAPGPLDGGSVNRSFNSTGSGNGTLAFDLIGYLSVDGVNAQIDTFSLTVNGTTIFSGSFDMGGGGTQQINTGNPSWVISSTSNGFFQGGLTQLSIPITILSGQNSLLFDYGSMQGLSDEGWGLQNASVQGQVSGGGGGSGSVPEPATIALMGLGLVGIGFARKKKSA